MERTVAGFSKTKIKESEDEEEEEGEETLDSVTTHLRRLSRPSIPRVSSFISAMNVFAEDDFCRKPLKNCNAVLLRGPRKFMKLCVCGLLMPILLLSIPLYIRLILYPPFHYMMAPTDQRTLDHTSSSFWCSGQRVYMNGSFNAYLLSDTPQISKNYSHHSMLQHITLKNDVKEYWGFHLLKGSLVSINLCSRYDGGTLMIMKGANNLHKCAWIGEEDSAEQDEDHKELSNESWEKSSFLDEAPMAHGELLMEFEKEKSIELNQNLKSEENTNLTSEERRGELEFYLKKIVKLSKNKKEIMKELGRQSSESKHKRKKKVSKKNNKKRKKKQNKHRKSEKLKRSINKEDISTDHDEEKDPDSGQTHSLFNNGFFNIKNFSNKTNDIFLSIFKTSKGLTYERGNINQTNPNDISKEEHRSSFSSSEEALMKCDGLLGVLPLYPSKNCLNFNNVHTNRIKYKIATTGTYYFVFSSDNEVFDLDMYFNLTLKRVVYDTNSALDSCKNKTDCSLLFKFWSNDQTVVEIPEGNWNDAYYMEIKCQPRVLVYLIFLFFIPISILFCAFH